MSIKKFVIAKEGPGDDPAKKRIKNLDDQVKQAQEQLKLAKDQDPKSDRSFNLQQRINTLKTQKDRLKKRTDDKQKLDKEEKASRGNWNPEVIKPKPRCRLCGMVVAKQDMVRLDGIYPAHKKCADAKHRSYTEGPTIHKQNSSTSCERHGQADCKSTMCPESPNFNVLTQV